MKLKYFIIILIIVIVVFRFYPKRPNISIPILLYHDFVTEVPLEDPDNFNYINTKEGFEENIEYLLNEGYTFISFEELNDAYNNKITLPDKSIMITFDDGYKSNYNLIYPILKKYNVKASIFVVTDNIGKEIDGKTYLTWEECKAMESSGLVKIYSHSKRHIFYDKFSPRTIYDDVKKSYEEIEKHLGERDLKVFAYPYGAYTKETVWVLKNSGIDMQVYDIGINKKLDKDYIKRINIPCEMTGKEIIEEINAYE